MVRKVVSGSVILLIIIQSVFCANRGSTCNTPNGERAKCIAIKSCKVIYDAISTGEQAAIEFAQQSQCGYDSDPLVCCGTTAQKRTGSPSSTKKPSLSPLLPDRSVCGKEKDENRVYGGEITDIGEFPWMVLVRYRYSDGKDAGFRCGGTLINNRYVLTAAHCVLINPNAGFSTDSVRLGEWRKSSEPDCEVLIAITECADPVVDVKIEKVVPHPQYNRRNGKNDIALVRLTRNVPYTDYIRAICLPHPEDPYPLPDTLLFVAGWGATENGSDSSDIKLKVQLPIVSNRDCDSKSRLRGRITDDHLCAGGIRGKDSCQGDSGGPLMKLIELTEQKQQWIQEGIVSYGIGCGTDGYPGVYTRVVKFITWITNNISA